jgi:hypothetical protein
MRYAIAASVAIALGMAVGMVPFVNMHLHWSFCFVLPVSGLFLGAGLGWVQFKMLRVTQARLTGPAILVLASAGAAGYLATDVGVYLTMVVPAGEPGAEPAPLREVVGFADYMSFRLAGSTLSRPGKDDAIEMGRTGTTITFVVDMLGALIGTGGILFSLRSDNPFCERCRRYQDAGTKVERSLGVTPTDADLRWGQLSEVAATGGYDALAGMVLDLPPVGPESTLKLTVAEMICQGCTQGTLLGSVQRRTGKKAWDLVQALYFRAASEEGQAPRLDG